MKEFSKTSLHNHFGGESSEIRRTSGRSGFDFDILATFEKLDKLKEHGFDLVALTNHNVFNPVHFTLSRKYAALLNITMIPGIEVDLSDETLSKYLHVVVIFDDRQNYFNLGQEIFSIYNGRDYLDMDSFIKMIYGKRCIVIPHGKKQKVRGADKNDEQFLQLVTLRNAIPVLLENKSKFKELQLKEYMKNVLNDEDYEWLDNSVSISTLDQADPSTSDYDYTYLWGKNTFDSLYIASYQKTRFVRESDKSENPLYISNLKIRFNDASSDSHFAEDNISIDFSKGLNTIIGKSGSGKTFLLDVIKRGLTGKGIEKGSSNTSDYDDLYDNVTISLYNSEDRLIDSNNNNIKVYEGVNLYNEVIKVFKNPESIADSLTDTGVDSTGFQLFRTSFNEYCKNYLDSKQKIKVLREELGNLLNSYNNKYKILSDNINFEKDRRQISYIHTDITARITMLSSDYEKTVELATQMRENYNQYLVSLNLLATELQIIEEIKQTKAAYESINKKLKNKLLTAEIELNKLKVLKAKQSFIKKTIDSYNNLFGERLSELANYKSEISTLPHLIVEKIKSIVKVKTQFSNLKFLNIEKFNSDLHVKDENIRLRTVKRNSTFNSDDFHKIMENSFSNGSRHRTKLLNRDFSDIELNLTSLESINKFLDRVFVQEKNVEVLLNSDYSIFIDYVPEVRIDDVTGFQAVEKLTAGLLSKFYIDKVMTNDIKNAGDFCIVLYDQPDNNMEKSFIYKELTNKIIELRKNHQIFVSTHEPLLVVNSEANRIIFATNDRNVKESNNIQYKSYTFDDLLSSRVNEHNIVAEEIVSLLDGKRDAIINREKLYGGLMNE